MDGENVTMSRKGGVWDEMKRTLIWTIQQLNPGEICDIQAQFKCNVGMLSQTAGGGGGFESYKFPVLARCHGDTNFSKIDTNSDYNQEGSTPVQLDIERSATILFRKI